VHEIVKSHDDAAWAPEKQGAGDGKDSGTQREMAPGMFGWYLTLFDSYLQTNDT
jgi:hypothetical protein